MLIRRRNGEGTEVVLNYIPLSSVLGNVLVDTDITLQEQCSVQKFTDSETSATYLQLYNFNNLACGATSKVLTVDLAYGCTRYAYYNGSGSSPDEEVQFIVRDSSQNVEV